jgi:hypothetical protein
LRNPSPCGTDVMGIAEFIIGARSRDPLAQPILRSELETDRIESQSFSSS